MSKKNASDGDISIDIVNPVEINEEVQKIEDEEEI